MKFGDKCGVTAIYLKNPTENVILVPSLLINMQGALQHRGQKSAGIGTFRNPDLPSHIEYLGRKRVRVYKGVGFVDEVFRLNDKEAHEKLLEQMEGVAGIGHNRYATSGDRKETYGVAIAEAQPFKKPHPRIWKQFALAFNGDITNYEDLVKELWSKEDYDRETKTDTEALVNLMSLGITRAGNVRDSLKSRKPDMFEVVGEMMGKLDGAYNVVSVFGDGSM